MIPQVSDEFFNKTIRIGTSYHSHASPVRVVFQIQQRFFDVICVPRGRANGGPMRLEVQGVEVFTNYRPQNHYQRVQYYRECARFLTTRLPKQITCKCCRDRPILPIDSTNILISEYRYPRG